MPDADVTHTMSLIYQEKGDLERGFLFAFLSAKDTRTDHEKWQQCAHIAIKLEKYNCAIYCFNRAWKLLSKETQYMEILEIKLQRIDIYMKTKDYTSIIRTIDKQLIVLEKRMAQMNNEKVGVQDENDIRQAIKHITEIKYKTLFE